jgi:carbon storage regulator
VLSRKPGERIHVGSGITVAVLQVQGNRVRIGIDAPGQVRILRAELAGGPGEGTQPTSTGAKSGRSLSPRPA